MPLQYMLVGEHAACCSSISIVSQLCLLRLRGNDAVSGSFLSALYFAHFPCCPPFLLCTFLLFLFFLFPLSLSPSLCPSVCQSVCQHSEVHDTATSKLFTSDHSLHLPCCSAPFVQNVAPRSLSLPLPPSPSLVPLLPCVHTRACTLSCTCSPRLRDPAFVWIFAASLDGS